MVQADEGAHWWLQWRGFCQSVHGFEQLEGGRASPGDKCASLEELAPEGL